MKEQIIDADMPVFPSKEYANHGTLGLELRDYFAAQAITALSRDLRNATGISDNIRNVAKLNAELAYLVADAMLIARQK